MKVGLLLHPERGIDSVLTEARRADEQGFDSVWLSDHLASPSGDDVPTGPHESFTLMTAIGAVTQRTRLAWAMLNLSFRRPIVLAKMLSTLDHISKGRLICAVGSGWFEKEYAAYDIPLISDHDARTAYAREVVRMFREVWTHPAPEKVTFEGKYIRATDLAFTPAPYQRPHPPIWIGGDSDATLESVKELADGWVMLTSGNRQRLSEVISQSDWPTRPMELVKNVRIHVVATRQLAMQEASDAFEAGERSVHKTLDAYLANEVIGTPDECVDRLGEIGSWGITCVRAACRDERQQDRLATMILPRLASEAPRSEAPK